MYVRQWSIKYIEGKISCRERHIQKFDDHAVNLQLAASTDRQAGLRAATRLESMHINDEHESATCIMIRYLPIQIGVRGYVHSITVDANRLLILILLRHRLPIGPHINTGIQTTIILIHPR